MATRLPWLGGRGRGVVVHEYGADARPADGGFSRGALTVGSWLGDGEELP